MKISLLGYSEETKGIVLNIRMTAPSPIPIYKRTKTISRYPKYPFPVIFDNDKWLKRPAVHVCKCQP